jgi:hypothetical protein
VSRETKIYYLQVTITRFVDKHPPGIIECEFEDSQGKTHTVVEKFPIVTSEDLWEDSLYPRPGLLRCQVVDKIAGRVEPELVRITTEEPDHVETTEGLSTFIVLADQLLEESK